MCVLNLSNLRKFLIISRLNPSFVTGYSDAESSFIHKSRPAKLALWIGMLN